MSVYALSVPGASMKKKYFYLSLLLIMGCSDKKSEEEIPTLDRIVQESSVVRPQEVEFRGTETIR